MIKNKLRIVASIEARMNSSRFPGKILTDVCGRPALSRLIDRLKRSKYLDDIVLATTVNGKDDVLTEWSEREKIPVYRGSEDDVLQRVVDAHRMMQTDIIVEITGDCILTDPDVIDLGIETFLANDCDVVTNCRYPSYPMGIDVQVFRYKDLAWVANNISDPAVREHVSLYFYEHPEQYKLIHLVAPKQWQGPSHRFQLDYHEDLQLITEIYRNLEPLYGDSFGINEIMQLVETKTNLLKINQHCIEKAVRA